MVDTASGFRCRDHVDECAGRIGDRNSRRAAPEGLESEEMFGGCFV